MASAGVQLFVYGSLKRGGRHHDELAGATFLGPVETVPGYRLEPLGEYVAMVQSREHGDPSTVQGELFELPSSKLPALDAFEGDSYSRGEVQVRPRHPPPSPPNQPNAADSTDTRFALAYFKKAR